MHPQNYTPLWWARGECFETDPYNGGPTNLLSEFSMESGARCAYTWSQTDLIMLLARPVANNLGFKFGRKSAELDTSGAPRTSDSTLLAWQSFGLLTKS